MPNSKWTWIVFISNIQFCVLLGMLEDGKYSQTCVAKSSVASGIATAEKRTHCGTQCTKPVSHTTGTSAPKQQNGFRTAEVGVDLHSVCLYVCVLSILWKLDQALLSYWKTETIFLTQPQHYQSPYFYEKLFLINHKFGISYLKSHEFVITKDSWQNSNLVPQCS